MARFALLARLRHPVWVFDIDRQRVYWANAEALKVWDATTLDELRSRDMGRDMSESVARRLRQYQSDFERFGMEFSESWTLYPNGKPRSLQVVFSGLRHQGSMMMLCEALGELQADPNTLRSAEALLHLPVLITLYHADGPALYRNPAAREKVLDPAESWQGHLLHAADRELLQLQLQQQGKGRLVAQVMTRHGERWHELSARHCRDAVSGADAVLISEVDVSELKDAEARARYLAMHDTLTGLPNRNFVLQCYPALLQQAKRQGEQAALLCIDLDRFKNINDSLGHAFGDLLLVQMGERLKALLAPTQQLARQGGDEFLVLLCAPQVQQQAAALAAAIVEALARPLWLRGQEVRLTASVGISLCQDGAEDIQGHMRHADLAMYSAKDAGRNGIQFYDEAMDARARTRLALEYEIRRAAAGCGLERRAGGVSAAGGGDGGIDAAGAGRCCGADAIARHAAGALCLCRILSDAGTAAAATGPRHLLPAGQPAVIAGAVGVAPWLATLAPEQHQQPYRGQIDQAQQLGGAAHVLGPLGQRVAFQRGVIDRGLDGGIEQFDDERGQRAGHQHGACQRAGRHQEQRTGNQDAGQQGQLAKGIFMAVGRLDAVQRITEGVDQPADAGLALERAFLMLAHVRSSDCADGGWHLPARRAAC